MIEEATLYDTARRVQEVPPEQRRIIVYTGVHPHEGTTQLARPHEDRWKKYGVLVVAHPSDSTPHAIWKRHKELCTDDNFRPLDYSVRIDETTFEDTIAGGEPTLFLRFHGTGIIPTLEERGYKPQEVAAWELKRRWDSLMFGDTNHTHPEAFRKVREEYTDLGCIYHDALPGNRIILEYMYEGVKFLNDDPFVDVLLAKHKETHPNGVPKIFHEDDTNGPRGFEKKGNISPRYLVQHTLSDSDKEEFHTVHVKLLDDLILLFSEIIKNSA